MSACPSCGGSTFTGGNFHATEWQVTEASPAGAEVVIFAGTVDIECATCGHQWDERPAEVCA